MKGRRRKDLSYYRVREIQMGKDQEQREASTAMSTPGKGGGGPGRGGGCPLDRLASKVARREGLAGEEVRETETNRGESGGSLGVKSKSVALSCTPAKVSLKQILRGQFRNWRWGRGHRPKSGARNLELVAKAAERRVVCVSRLGPRVLQEGTAREPRTKLRWGLGKGLGEAGQGKQQGSEVSVGAYRAGRLS